MWFLTTVLVNSTSVLGRHCLAPALAAYAGSKLAYAGAKFSESFVELTKAHDDVAMTLKLGKTPTQFLLAQIQLVNLCTYNIHTCIELYLDRVTTE